MTDVGDSRAVRDATWRWKDAREWATAANREERLAKSDLEETRFKALQPCFEELEKRIAVLEHHNKLLEAALNLRQSCFEELEQRLAVLERHNEPHQVLRALILYHLLCEAMEQG